MTAAVPGAPQAFDAYVAQRNVSAARLACVLVALLMPAGLVLDWLTHPEAVRAFAALRFGSALLALVPLALTYAPWAPRHGFVLGVAPALVCAAAIAMMIDALEGYASPYYAGLSLCILGMGVVFTWTARQAAVAASLVVLLWVLPALASERVLELGPFFNNLYFLSLTALIMVVSNATRHRLAKNEFEARMEVARTSTELARTLDRLKELDRLKSQFFSNITHELRTPLTLIIAPLDQLLSEGRPGDAHRDTLELVRRNAERLLRLINDLLDLSRLDAGGLRLNVAPVDLRALAAQVCEVFQPAARAQRVTLTLEADGAVGDTHGDPHRLEIVLTNLLGNALKFTPEGGRIVVRVGLRDGGACVGVEDSGPGIPAADLERVFERFHQVEGGERRSRGGTGIGLALARELVGLHGGRLTVDSTLGEGSTFRVWLPLGRAHFRPDVIERRRARVEGRFGRRAEDHAACAAAVPLEPRRFEGPAEALPIVLDGGRRARVLVAEDQPELRAFIVGVLRGSFEVSAAADGEEAWEKVRAERPDLVLSDVMMPRKSGHELCQAIKSDPTLRATPVILLTARGGSEHALDGYAHGADDFVVKPFHTRVLLARVRAQLHLRALGMQLASQAGLAAVGTLAAGVAHEVRNPLNALLTAAAVLEGGGLPEARARKLCEVVLEAGRRILAITSALDQHARPAERGGMAAMDVGQCMDATLRLLEHRADGVAIHREYASARRAVVPAGPVNQVFLNVLDNALRERPGNIWIGVRDEGARVVVRIGDDGPGVPPELEARVFDPFFTTRAPGEGTGLGLYLSRQLMTTCGGELRLERRRGGGAEFAIELPAEAA